MRVSDRTLTTAAATICMVCCVLVVAGIALIIGARVGVEDAVFEVFLRLLLFIYVAIGYVIVRRFRRHIVGWIFIAAGTASIVNDAGFAYARYGLEREGLIGTSVAAWVTTWAWLPSFGAIGALLLLFPDGHPPSSRWRVVGWAGTIGMILATLGNALWFRPIDGFESIKNPFGLRGTAGAVAETALAIGTTALFFSILLAGVSLVIRLKRSRGERRQQIKWFAFAAAILAVGLFGIATTYREGAPVTPVVAFFQGLAIAGAVFVAVAAAIAIFKYRLYEIDVIINRTLVYAILTGILAAAYAGSVFGFQTVLGPLASDSDLAVAASTLAVAALFRPVRERVQDFIDRRFYRRKFDAERTLEGFSAKLREEVDLAQLSAALTRVTVDTMQPAHVSLWLREGSA